MTSYHHILLTSDNIIVFPSVAVAIENILLLFSPALAIVGEHLTRHLPKQWLTSSVIEGSAGCNCHAEDTVAVIEAPCQSDLLIELIRKLKPQVVVHLGFPPFPLLKTEIHKFTTDIEEQKVLRTTPMSGPQVVVTGIALFEAITSAVFVNLLSTTKDVGSRLFLDISEHLDLSNPPSSNGVLKYLAKSTLPSHAAIPCGLKNQVYSDLEVAFAISEDTAVNKALSQTIELLEGHTSVISQKYYGCLFHELLVSQIGDWHAQQERQAEQVIPQNLIGFSNSAMSTLEETEFFVPDSKESGIIHMDLDRGLLPLPSTVKASIFESFVGQNITDSETNVGSIIEKRMESIYGFPGPGPCCSDKIPGCSKEIIFGSTCLALFSKLVLCCMQEPGTFFFPLGTNGHYVSAAKFMNANTLTIPTNSGSGFKIKPEDLEAALADVRGKKVTRPWVYISGPTINPSVLLCSNNEIKDLLSICVLYGARVVLDTSFSGLEFQIDYWSWWDLKGFSYNIDLEIPLTVFMLGDLSLELTMAGFDLGFLIFNNPSLVKHSFKSLSRPHSTLKYTLRKLLDLEVHWDGNFRDVILQQKETLKNRANHLAKTLVSCGWDVKVVSRCWRNRLPTSGKSFRTDGFEGELNGCNIREAILRSTGLCISSSKWTRIPDYCRFSFALESNDSKSLF